MDLIIANFNYWVFIALLMLGLHAMIVKKNLVKKLIGMTIFQTAIILFYVSMARKVGGTIPILKHHGHGPIDPHHYMNPLPHVLMLTAIVVGVATLGVGLAIAEGIYATYGTTEEDAILEQINNE